MTDQTKTYRLIELKDGWYEVEVYDRGVSQGKLSQNGNKRFSSKGVARAAAIAAGYTTELGR